MVLFISSGLVDPKKSDHPFARMHLYLNYGLLGLASIVHAAGHNAKVFHGHFSDPEIFLKDGNLRALILSTEYPLFLSLPSVQSISWAAKLVRLVKNLRNDLPIVVGGRWVLREDVTWLLPHLPGVDLFVFGTAEDRIVTLLDKQSWSQIPYTDLNRTSPAAIRGLPMLNYELLDEAEEFTSSLEISRGCGMGCYFCLERDVPLGLIRNPGDVVSELIRYSEYFGSGITPYFECSFFRPTSAWVESLAAEYAFTGLNIRWRTETRVDGVTAKQLSRLASAGLKVIDLGLESASSQQLTAMGKTTRPDVYLRKASDLLSACHDNGVWAKVNVLLYAGEDNGTLDETCTWLEQRKHQIKGVSVNPLTVYRDGTRTAAYLEQLVTQGAIIPDAAMLDHSGWLDIHPSKWISRAEAQDHCLRISRHFMDSHAYYDLKAFSYFPRSLTRSRFTELYSNCSPDSLPFSVSSIYN